MAECVVNYSPETARAAARAFLWRRYLTKVGIFFLSSLIVCTAMLIVWLHFWGADWFVGFLGTLIGFNLILHVTAFSALPRAMAKAVAALSPPRSGRITTTSDGITVAVGGNVSVLPWSRFKYVWLLEHFTLLGLSMFRVLHVPADGMTPEVRADLAARASPIIWA